MMSENAPLLRLERISKSFGGTKVVSDLTLHIQDGEFLSILGPSGCGKTTLLRIIAGFFESEGEIHLEAARIDQVPSHKRNTALVFQNYALFPHMTVFENVAFGLRMEGRPKDEIENRVGEILRLVRLDGFEKRYPKELSGGQQQRTALARAIVVRPKLLLLDEPLSNLDAKLRKELRQEILRVHRATGITSIFVTHDLEEAFSLSDRVAVMNNGKIEQIGAPYEIFTQPKTRFVADFIGHSNVLDGALSKHAGQTVLESCGFKIQVLSSIQPAAAGRFAIPNHVIRVGKSAEACANCFPVTIADIVYSGSTVEVTAQLGQTHIQCEVPASAELLALKIGASAPIGWLPEDMIRLPE